MSTKDTGGPAFPLPITRDPEGGIFDPRGYGADGMNLRDYFAAKALPIAVDYTRRIDADGDGNMVDKNECRFDLHINPDDDDEPDDCSFVAEIAYRLADAMLKARNA